MDKLFEMLEALAAKLGTTVEALAPHVVRHTQIKAIAGLVVWGVITALAWSLLVLRVRSALRRDWTGTRDYQQAAAVVPIVVLAILCFVTVVAATVEGSSLVAAALEPVGATVRMLLGKATK